jgi:methionyl-tRNA synthetase
MLSEDNWFFKLSAFREQLLEKHQAKTIQEACQPASARNEVISFLEGEVRDLSYLPINI